MLRNKHIIYCTALLLMAIMHGACNKDLPLPDIKQNKKITLFGEFIAGDTMHLRAGQSISVSSTDQMRFQLLKDFTILVKDATGAVYNMTGYEDAASATLHTLPYTLSKKTDYNNTYTITATHAAIGTVTATISIPGPIDAKVTDTGEASYNSNKTLRIRVKINDPANAVNYYAIEAVKQQMTITGYFFYDNQWINIQDDRSSYELLKASGNLITRFDTVYKEDYTRQAIYTADGNTDNVKSSGAGTAYRRILLADRQFNGSPYETEVYVLDNTEFPGTEFNNGRIILYIKSVSEDYFKFLKAYEAYDPAAGYSSIQQPVKIDGNVINGLGMIGAVSQVKYIYIKDSWGF